MNCIREEAPQRLQATNLIVEDLPGELMVYDPNRNKAFCLNQTAASVWKHADGTRTIAEIAGSITTELEKPVGEDMVRFALSVLAKDGLLEPQTVKAIVPVGVTRRQMLQKLGVGAMALPAVSVLFVSPAKAHASSISTPPTPPTSSSLGAPSNHRESGFWSWLENLF
jgi:hypothetical protein